MGVEVDAVTEMLERALAQLSKLPPPKQDEVAAWLLAASAYTGNLPSFDPQ